MLSTRIRLSATGPTVIGPTIVGRHRRILVGQPQSLRLARPSSSRRSFDASRSRYTRHCRIGNNWCRASSIVVHDQILQISGGFIVDHDDDNDWQFEEPPLHQPQLLASSAISYDDDDEQAWWRQFIRWIRRQLKSCWDAVIISLRGTEIVLRMSPLMLLTPTSMLSHRMLGRSGIYVNDVTWWYFTANVQALGPAFVKLCQWIATRRDIFPPHVCDRLSSLHDRGRPHAWKHTEQMLVEAFGADYAQRGLLIDPDDELLGIGSAGQVYRGKLQRDDDQPAIPVAVKVLHPRFEKLVGRDLWCMQTVAEMLHTLPIQQLRMLNLPRATANFGAVLFRQADLKIEGRNLSQFRDNFYHHNPNSAILFPQPMQDWMATNVLVEELVDGAQPIAEFLKNETVEGRQIRRELAKPLLRSFLKMVFLDNFVHSDLHPGNVMVLTRQVRNEPSVWRRMLLGQPWPYDSTTRTERKIVFLDAGITTSLSDKDQRNLQDLFKAVITNEGYRAGELMVERATYERATAQPDGKHKFATGIAELVSEFHDRRREGLTLGNVRVGSLLSRVLDLCREHGVEIDPSMATIVLSTLVLEGLGRSLEPSLNLIDFAMPFVLGRGKV